MIIPQGVDLPGAGLCGIICNDSARYSLFSSCVDKLTLPPGATKEWLIGGDWCGARNDLARMVLENENFKWLWFMDDDHVFSPDLLVKLLDHNLPLVVPVCLTRVPPFAPVTYVERVTDVGYLPLPLSDEAMATDGLIELQAGGCAGMLIRREVLEAVEPPWFEYTDRSEDIIFSEKAKAAGFQIYCDLSARLGHISTAVVWPTVADDQWRVGFTIGRDLQITVPFEDMTKEKETA